MSPTTLLCRIMALPTDPVGLVKQLAIDDFSFRRGRTDGTVLVDGVRQRVIDLFAVKRDEMNAFYHSYDERFSARISGNFSGGDDASTASQGAPQATQSADHFH